MRVVITMPVIVNSVQMKEIFIFVLTFLEEYSDFFTPYALFS